MQAPLVERAVHEASPETAQNPLEASAARDVLEPVPADGQPAGIAINLAQDCLGSDNSLKTGHERQVGHGVLRSLGRRAADRVSCVTSILIKLINIRVAMSESRPSHLIPADEALVRLGVSRQTLYAYVSRGLVRAEPAPDDPRRSLYDRRDLDRLVERRRRGRARKDIAASAIDFGEPVLASAITRIGDDGLFYRGQDATRLAAAATLEEVATLLWEGRCLVVPPLAEAMPAAPEAPIERCLRVVAVDAIGPPIWGRAEDALLTDAARLLRCVAWPKLSP